MVWSSTTSLGVQGVVLQAWFYTQLGRCVTSSPLCHSHRGYKLLLPPATDPWLFSWSSSRSCFYLWKSLCQSMVCQPGGKPTHFYTHPFGWLHQLVSASLKWRIIHPSSSLVSSAFCSSSAPRGVYNVWVGGGNQKPPKMCISARARQHQEGLQNLSPGITLFF